MTTDTYSTTFMSCDPEPTAAKEIPFEMAAAWLTEAEASEPNDPNAMALATTDSDGCPSVRMVLLKGLDLRGFVFYTNDLGRKGQELAARPQAALCLHWKSLRRQIRVEGPIIRTSDEEADAYYNSRSRKSRIGAWASRQSETMDQRQDLIDRAAEFDAKYPDDAIPRPPHWGGYRLVPMRIEFWLDGPARLHDRIVFERENSEQSQWTVRRLYP